MMNPKYKIKVVSLSEYKRAFFHTEDGGLAIQDFEDVVEPSFITLSKEETKSLFTFIDNIRKEAYGNKTESGKTEGANTGG